MRFPLHILWFLRRFARLERLLPEALAAQARFELLSRLGRRYARNLDLDPARANYLNLGCGGARIPGFVNIDFFSEGDGADYETDLRFPLRIPSSSVDGVFTEHTLEHLAWDENARLLRECWRVLKPGGAIRVVVPDISLFAERYASGDRAWFDKWERLVFTESADPQRRKRRLASPMQAISFVTQEYGHRSCWDFDSLRVALTEAGFADIRKESFGRGANPRLLCDLDEPDRTHVSLYAEATKH